MSSPLKFGWDAFTWMRLKKKKKRLWSVYFPVYHDLSAMKTPRTTSYWCSVYFRKKYQLPYASLKNVARKHICKSFSASLQIFNSYDVLGGGNIGMCTNDYTRCLALVNDCTRAVDAHTPRPEKCCQPDLLGKQGCSAPWLSVLPIVV